MAHATMHDDALMLSFDSYKEAEAGLAVMFMLISITDIGITAQPTDLTGSNPTAPVIFRVSHWAIGQVNLREAFGHLVFMIKATTHIPHVTPAQRIILEEIATSITRALE